MGDVKFWEGIYRRGLSEEDYGGHSLSGREYYIYEQKIPQQLGLEAGVNEPERGGIAGDRRSRGPSAGRDLAIGPQLM